MPSITLDRILYEWTLGTNMPEVAQCKAECVCVCVWAKGEKRERERQTDSQPVGLCVCVCGRLLWHSTYLQWVWQYYIYYLGSFSSVAILLSHHHVHLTSLLAVDIPYSLWVWIICFDTHRREMVVTAQSFTHPSIHTHEQVQRVVTVCVYVCVGLGRKIVQLGTISKWVIMGLLFQLSTLLWA